VALAISSLLISSPLVAETGEQKVEKGTFKGSMVGMLLGGLLGGPPGVVLGMSGGAMIGGMEARKQQVSELQSELSAAEAAQQREQQVAAEHQALFQRQRAKEVARIEALQHGYTFCLGFRSDSAVIEPGIDRQLKALAVMLQAFPELKLQISAGADVRGSEDYNNKLSKRRAEAVAAALTASGLPETRMEIHYIGEAQARYSMQDLEGLSYDRTVRISLLEGGES
jgi:outer membrane protein OmpA-like peptidoglycan-associated protein